MGASRPESPGPGRVRLRGHHLICLQFFRGEGYSAEFVENLGRIVELAANQPVQVVEGADDVCRACPELGADGTCADPQAGEVEVDRLDRLAAEVLGIGPGELTTLSQVGERLASDAFAVGRWRFEACGGCAWEDVCDQGWNRMVGAAEKASRKPPGPAK